MNDAKNVLISQCDSSRKGLTINRCWSSQNLSRGKFPATICPAMLKPSPALPGLEDIPSGLASKSYKITFLLDQRRKATKQYSENGPLVSHVSLRDCPSVPHNLVFLLVPTSNTMFVVVHTVPWYFRCLFHGLRLSSSAVENLRAHGEGPVKRSKNQNCLSGDNRSNQTSKKLAKKLPLQGFYLQDFYTI